MAARGMLVVLIGVFLSVMSSSAVRAVDSCKVKVDPKTGTLSVSGRNVTGAVLWGNTAATVTNAFSNAATCVSGGTATKCQLGSSGTPAAVTPPALCTLYLADGGASTCSAFIKGCTPGVRSTSSSGTGVVIKDSVGAVVGVANPVSSAGSTTVVRDAGGGELYTVKVSTSGLPDSPFSAVYVSADCSGQGLLAADDSAFAQAAVQVSGGKVHVSFPPSTSTTVHSESVNGYTQPACVGIAGTFTAPDTCCFSANTTAALAPIEEIDLSGLIPPFHSELQ